MPELPEVEVVKRGLNEFVKENPKIEGFDFYRGDLRTKIPKKKLVHFVGAKITGIERRAKYLVIKTDHGDLLSHLGMSGVWKTSPTADPKHDHIRIRLSNGKNLIYRDPRRFGIFEILDKKNQKKLQALGPEPLSDHFTGELLWRSLRGKKTALKMAIMDQRVVVGVGNIYACEALYLSKLSPFKKADKLSRGNSNVLVKEIKNVLIKSIEAGGSSISDFASLGNILGSYQDQHFVYDQEGKPCRFCGTPIKRKTQSGRSTFYCPVCQVS